MSRTAQIYSAIHTRSDGVRERIELMPAANGITSETPFPKFSLMQISGGGAAFDKYPSGLIKFDERTLKFHLDYMYEADPVLTDYILSPNYEDYVNIWTISTDGGDSELPVSEFPITFRGVQIAQPTDEFENKHTGTEITIKILHIARYLAEQSVPAELADTIIAQLDLDFWELCYKCVARRNLYDIVYTQADGTVVYVADSGKLFNEPIKLGVHNQVAVMFKFPMIFACVQLWMQKTYARIIHAEGAELMWRNEGLPSDTCTFYSPNQTAQVRLADIDTDVIFGKCQLWFPALIFEEGHSVGGLQDVPGFGLHFGTAKVIGGYLFDGEMFRSYQSIHDWIMDIASNFFCKITYSITPTGNVEISCLPLLSEEPIILNKSDFVREEKTYKRNLDRVRGCDAEVSGGGENDITQVEYFKNGSTENRTEGNVKCLFHNSPSASGFDDEYFEAQSYFTAPYYAPELKRNGSLSATHRIYAAKRNGFRSNVLYCDFSSEEYFHNSYGLQFVRAGRNVVLTDGVSSYDRSRDDDMPIFDYSGRSVAEELIQGWAVEIQKTDGLPYALCLANTQIFANTMLYEGTADYKVISPSDVGKVYDMTEFIHPALEGKTPQYAILTKVTENRDEHSNLLPSSVEFFAFNGD